MSAPAFSAVTGLVSRRAAAAVLGQVTSDLTMHTASLGTLRAVTDSSGNNILNCSRNASYPDGSMLTYTPFGAETCGCTQATIAFKFATYERDSGTGWDNAQARTYASNVARFLSPDPAGLAAANPANPQTWDRYAYVGNQPLEYTDRTGLCPPCCGNPCNVTAPWPCIGSCGGGGGGGGGVGGGGCGGGPSTEFVNVGMVTAEDCGGGGGSSRVGPGGNPTNPPPGAPPPGPSIWSRFTGWASSELACTNNLADKASIAGGLHALGVANGGGLGTTIVNAALGNPISGLFGGFDRSAPGATILLSGTYLGFGGGGLAQEGLAGTAIKAGSGGFWSAVTGAGETVTTLFSGEVSLASTGITVAEAGSGVGTLIIGYDVLSWLGSAAACVGRK
ncbi:MAG: RHS repeat-associated core domain-containing protein [Terriglobales bacterium]